MTALPPGYAVRRAREEDCAALPEIEDAAAELFRPLNLIDFDSDGPGVVTLDYLQRQCAAGLLWVAIHEDAPVGFVVGDIRDGDPYVAELDVHPAHGRKGLGRALMEIACAKIFAQGYPRVTLNTFREVPWNAPFYASLGFTEIAKADWTLWMHDLNARMAEDIKDMSTRVFMELTRGG